MKKLLMVAAVLLIAAPNAAQAQMGFGAQASWGSDADLGVGARLVMGLPNIRTGLQGILSGDYFFIDCGGADCSWIELNANAAIPLAASGLNPYVGGGLNVARISVDVNGFGNSSATEIGLNVLGGLKFSGSLSPFAEARLSLGGGEQFVITGGIMLGGSR